jgi:hypothetical protein
MFARNIYPEVKGDFFAGIFSFAQSDIDKAFNVEFQQPECLTFFKHHIENQYKK